MRLLGRRDERVAETGGVAEEAIGVERAARFEVRRFKVGGHRREGGIQHYVDRRVCVLQLDAQIQIEEVATDRDGDAAEPGVGDGDAPPRRRRMPFGDVPPVDREDRRDVLLLLPEMPVGPITRHTFARWDGTWNAPGTT